MTVLATKFLCYTDGTVFGIAENEPDSWENIQQAIIQHLLENPDHEIVQRFVLADVD